MLINLVILIYLLYRSVIPSEEELILALRTLKVENPTLGIAKTHALLLETHEWTVSEKRVRKSK